MEKFFDKNTTYILKQKFFHKNILVTGGFGFIGSHLVKRLLDYKANVSILTTPQGNKFRLAKQLDEIEIYGLDIANTGAVDLAVSRIMPDYVFHLASYGVNSAQHEFIKATQTNVLGSINLMNAVAKKGCIKFVNMGSCAEYGNRKEITDLVLKPVTAYGSSKAAATTLLHQMGEESSVDIITLRPFGVFGESEESHKLFCDIMLKILKEEEILLTKCEQKRDYCHVENIVNAMLLAANSEVQNEIFDVASGELHPLTHYVNLICKIAKTDLLPQYGALPYRSQELWSPQASISLIKEKIGWDISVSLEEGIEKTFLWYKENINDFLARR